MQTLTNVVPDLRLALRRLFREPAFTIAATLTIAVGIGIVAAVFALFEGVLLRPLPYPDAGRLVSIRHMAPGTDLRQDRVSAGIFLHYRDGNRVFEGVGGYEPVSFTFTDGGSAERIRTALVTPELLPVLRVSPQLGRLPTAEDWNMGSGLTAGTTGVLLGHDLWVRRYGADPAVIGRTIEIDGGPFAVVTGVAHAGFSFPDPPTQAWLVYPQDPLAWSGRAEVREGMILSTVARLRPGVTLAEAEADLNRLVQRLPDAFPDITAEEVGTIGLRAQVRPFKDEIVGEVRLTLLLVLASGGFLLLVTWANVANLLLLRTHARRVEIGITRALGASEANVAARLLSESLLLTVGGGLVGLALASAAIGARFGFAPRQLPRLEGIELNAPVIALVAVLAIVSGVLMAAICLASTRERAAGPALSALRSRSATQRREGRTGRTVLVAAQMALALTLLVGSGLMARTFWQLQQVDLGFQPEGKLTFYLPVTHLGLGADHTEFATLHAQVLERLRAVPGVSAVEAASTSVFPLAVPEGAADPATIAPAAAADDGRESWPRAYYGYATPAYFEAMGIPLLAGRAFRSEDSSPDAPGVILSESLARALFPNVNPIGREVQFPQFSSFWTEQVVVGVVGDVPGTNLREGDARAIYLPHVHPLATGASSETLHPYLPRWEMYVVRTGRDVGSILPEIRRAVADVDPRLPVMDVAALDAIVADATAQERFTLRLLLVSSGAAVFLAMVGIYGVLAYSVRRRTAEIGIRIALGASPARVTRHVVRQGAVIGGIGIAAGVAGALALTRSMASLLFGTSPTDPLTFGAMTLVLFAVALSASYIPARRASRIDPARALRAD